MSVRLTTENLKAIKTALYDSTTGWSLTAPVFENEEDAERFITFVEEKWGDLRKLTEDELRAAHTQWFEEDVDLLEKQEIFIRENSAYSTKRHE